MCIVNIKPTNIFKLIKLDADTGSLHRTKSQEAIKTCLISDRAWWRGQIQRFGSRQWKNISTEQVNVVKMQEEFLHYQFIMWFCAQNETNMHLLNSDKIIAAQVIRGHWGPWICGTPVHLPALEVQTGLVPGSGLILQELDQNPAGSDMKLCPFMVSPSPVSCQRLTAGGRFIRTGWSPLCATLKTFPWWFKTEQRGGWCPQCRAGSPGLWRTPWSLLSPHRVRGSWKNATLCMSTAKTVNNQ